MGRDGWSVHLDPHLPPVMRLARGEKNFARLSPPPPALLAVQRCSFRTRRSGDKIYISESKRKEPFYL